MNIRLEELKNLRSKVKETSSQNKLASNYTPGYRLLREVQSFLVHELDVVGAV